MRKSRPARRRWSIIRWWWKPKSKVRLRSTTIRLLLLLRPSETTIQSRSCKPIRPVRCWAATTARRRPFWLQSPHHQLFTIRRLPRLPTPRTYRSWPNYDPRLVISYHTIVMKVAFITFPTQLSDWAYIPWTNFFKKKKNSQVIGTHSARSGRTICWQVPTHSLLPILFYDHWGEHFVHAAAGLPAKFEKAEMNLPQGTQDSRSLCAYTHHTQFFKKQL